MFCLVSGDGRDRGLPERNLAMFIGEEWADVVVVRQHWMMEDYSEILNM